jgi:hypothetical protein
MSARFLVCGKICVAAQRPLGVAAEQQHLAVLEAGGGEERLDRLVGAERNRAGEAFCREADDLLTLAHVGHAWPGLRDEHLLAAHDHAGDADGDTVLPQRAAVPLR